MIKTIIFWLSLCPCLIIASLLLEIPAIIIFPISPRLSRKYTGVVVSCAWFRLMAVSIMDNITLFQFSFFSIYAVWLIQAMLDQVCGVKFVTYGDFRRKISRKVPTVIISNHGSLFDLHCLIRGLRGLFGNMTLSQAFPVTTERFRRSHIYLGWLKQMHHFIFVKRDWARDCIHMKKLIHYLLETCSTIQVVLYPEGMVRTDASMKEDKVYAESKGFATFKHLLHLKVKGFVAIVQACRSGGNGEVEICEVTVAYKGKSGQCSYAGPIGGVQLPTGELPHEVHFHFKYHSSSSLPSSDEELREWLYKRWCEKDELLTQFHETNSFPGPVLQESWRSKLEMRLAMGAWALLVAAVIYFWIQMPLLMGVIMGTSALIHYVIDKWCDGWERLALKRWENSKN